LCEQFRRSVERMRKTTGLLILVVGVAIPCRADDDRGQAILRASGVQGGLIVHLGCSDGTLTAEMAAGNAFLVHGLDTNAINVAKAREQIESASLSGKVSIDLCHGRRLPYADNLVNLLIVENVGNVPMDEIMRVLVPRGVALIADVPGQKSAVPSGKMPHTRVSVDDQTWTKIVKPWPDRIDEWTHYLHDATGNAVAHDRSVTTPKRLQWMGKPLWSRSHEYDSSLSAMVSAAGRLFYIFDEGPTGIVDKRIPDRWTLIARDAFNGVILWRCPIANWGWRAWKRAEMEQVDWRRMKSQRFQLPPTVARRLVAASDRVYVTLGYKAPLTALDAATGRTIRTYGGTEGTDEIVQQDDLLVLCLRPNATTSNSSAGTTRPGSAGDSRLMALNANTGRLRWHTDPGVVVPLTLALSGSHLFYHDRDAVVCLDATTGKKKWRTPAGGANSSARSANGTLVVHNEVVLYADRKQLWSISVADGNVLWSLPGARGFGIANPPDLFVANGLVWYGHGDIHAESITGYHPSTGQPVRTAHLGPLITRGHHARCYRSKATDDFLLLSKRGVEFVDLNGQQHSRNNWVRGACRYGVLPCNGLLYSTPHPCFCYAGVKLGGFLALSGESTADISPSSDIEMLEHGPAYNFAGRNRTSTAPTDWPMYRHDPKRSGSTSTAVDPPVHASWKSQLGGKLAQPIVAGDRLFATRVDAGQICCLDTATGKPIWNYLCGGRIDSPPTYDDGRLLFGSADGWVYCLRATDGILIWRFRAAPDDRRIVAFGQIESAWPVHGSVLVMNDVAYVAAGRSSFLDGGIFLYGLDPTTGEKKYETRLDGPYPDTNALDEDAYAMEGAKTDLLVTDGTLIYLFHNAFNQRLEKQDTPVKGEPGVRNLGVRDFGPHLFSNAGFLDDSWFSRSYWMYGDHWPAFNFAHQSPKAGQLLVFDDTQTYAVKVFARRNMLSPLFFPATDGYFLVAVRNDNEPVLVSSDGKQGPKYLRWLPQTGALQTCWNLGVGFARGKPAQWVSNVPVRIRALVRTGNAVFAAGTPDVCDPDDPAAALEGRKGAVLMAFASDDGKKLFECPLDVPPVFDGLAAVEGRLFVATTDGSAICLSGESAMKQTAR